MSELVRRARFQPPTIAQRGQLARTMAAVQKYKPQHGEATGKVPCEACGRDARYSIQSNGLSRGQCSCGLRWCQ